MKITFSELRQLVRQHLFEDSVGDSLQPSNIRILKDESVMPLEIESLEEDFKAVNEQTLLKEAEQRIEELKTISEEIRRMKQLVDFRSPLLGKENS